MTITAAKFAKCLFLETTLKYISVTPRGGEQCGCCVGLGGQYFKYMMNQLKNQVKNTIEKKLDEMLANANKESNGTSWTFYTLPRTDQFDASNSLKPNKNFPI